MSTLGLQCSKGNLWYMQLLCLYLLKAETHSMNLATTGAKGVACNQSEAQQARLHLENSERGHHILA